MSIEIGYKSRLLNYCLEKIIIIKKKIFPKRVRRVLLQNDDNTLSEMIKHLIN